MQIDMQIERVHIHIHTDEPETLTSDWSADFRQLSWGLSWSGIAKYVFIYLFFFKVCYFMHLYQKAIHLQMNVHIDTST